MNLRFRPFLLATAVLLLGAADASAQFIELITEANVTLTAEINTVTPNGLDVKKTTVNIPQTAFMDRLVRDGIIPTADKTGWSLVAVRSAPADLAFVDGDLKFYVVNPTFPTAAGTRIALGENELIAQGMGAVKKYIERHQGQYIYSSKGVITNHMRLNYLPNFDIGGKTYQMAASQADGFASLSYLSKDFYSESGASYEIFFYAISSIKLIATGGFQVAPPTLADPNAPSQGLIKITLNVGPARLVPQSNYPDADVFYP